MKATVIIPSRNDRGYLKYAIESVKNQTKPVKLIVQKGEYGVSKNINDALKKVTTEFVSYIGDDDLLHPDASKLAIEGLRYNDIVHGNAVRFKDVSNYTIYKPIIKVPTFLDLINHNHIHGGTVWYRTDVLQKYMFDETLWTGEEYDLHIRMLKGGCKIGYINEVMFYYRLHQFQKSIGNTQQEYQDKRKLAINQIRKKYV
jgi:glycosyltransferase involved in cell wall biosynthesis